MENLINFRKSSKLNTKNYLKNCKVVDINDFRKSETYKDIVCKSYINLKYEKNILVKDINSLRDFLYSQLTRKQKEKVRYILNLEKELTTIAKISKSEKIHSIIRTIREKQNLVLDLEKQLSEKLVEVKKVNQNWV